MDDDLEQQLTYYRRRAREYDETAYDLSTARARIEGLVARLALAGRVLEIACGTGLWTEFLARTADSVVALDAAPEVLAIARERVRAGNVVFETADVFSWKTDRTFDTIFFSAWLSHVPDRRFAEFWQKLRTLLAAGGRVLLVDEHVDVAAKETRVVTVDELVERRLADGSVHRVVKNFIDPPELTRRLHSLGWSCTIVRDGPDWVLGDARPASA